jgi:ATP-dependent protease ClpP protease subunit
MFTKSPHTLFSQDIEVLKHNRLFIDDLIQEGADLHEILNKLHSSGEADSLEIRINSCGGYVKYGQQLINVMRDKFHERCVTVIDAEASSMAALIFMAGDSRIIYPHSVLMVHDVSMYMVGKVNETRRQMDTYVPVFTKYFKDLFGDTMSDTEVDALFSGQDFWFGAKEMCERGMADYVIVNGNTTKAGKYLESLENPEPPKEKKKSKKEKKEKKDKSVVRVEVLDD